MSFLNETWPSLLELTAQPTPYQHRGWLASWARPHQEPYILTVSDAAGLQAALPLVRSDLAGGRSQVMPLSSPSAESICVMPRGI
ncbi:hypothetical protein AMK32_31660 [Streptomyces sp. CB01883]|nr:hypothetical protein AMK32_31660 [Streptomyces sp. CB01883]